MLILFICIITGYIKEIALLFLFVMMHELCHVLSARIFKLEINEIEIFPFGGVARIDNIESAGPLREVIISVAGPLFNVFQASLLFFLHKNGVFIFPDDYKFIMDINITLAIFNLLPGLPLDGGRIFRAVLTYYTGYRKATRTAVITGKVIAALLFIYAVISSLLHTINWTLAAMPFFLYISAKREEEFLMYTVIRDVMRKSQYIKNEKVIDAVEMCAYENTRVRELLKYFDLNKYHIIIVLDGNMKVLCILTESEVVNSFSGSAADITLGELCSRIKK